MAPGSSTSLELTQMYHSFFYNWVIFHCLYVPQLPYPFICWQMSRLLPVQFSSVAQSDSAASGFTVHHPLPEATQTHVYWVGDAIQPSDPLSSPSPPTFNLSHHQGIYKWVCSSHQVAKVFEFQLQHQSFRRLISFRMDWLDLLAIQESSPTPQFKCINSSVLRFIYRPALTSIHDSWKKHSLD